MTQTASNVLYLALLLGLWASVAAAYMPGTGLLEIGAVATLAGTLFILTRKPTTNWFAVLLIVAGALVFPVIPRFRRRSARLALIGLPLQVGGGLFIFPITNGAVPVSWPMLFVTVAISFCMVQYILIPTLATQDLPIVMNDEGILPGSLGKVVMPLTPTGTVNIRGELWTAYSDRPVQAGDEVIVLAKDGLKLHVERVKAKRIPSESLEEAT